MLRYFAKKPRLEGSSSNISSEIHENDTTYEPPTVQTESFQKINNESVEQKNMDADLPELPSDPALRIRILDYYPNIRERVRRQYLVNGPCRLRKHDFKKTKFGEKSRRFVPSWFDEYSWLEYSVTKEAAYCFYCYLFKDECGNQGGGDTFVGEGFTNWRKKEKFREHEGGKNSSHFRAYEKCKNLLNLEQHIETSFSKMTEQGKLDYRLQLSSSIKCARFLLHHGLPFRGHDESENSNNRGLYIELLQFLADNNEEISRVVLDKAKGNLKLTSPPIQKDIVKTISQETTNLIIKELDGGFFAVLIDEARDVSTKEQMAVVLRFVNKKGCVVERFLSLKKVASTTAKSLKSALDGLFAKHSLSISMLRGQGYDGASNMRGEYNGLKALILKENVAAHFIHCFAHQLQLALVAVAKKHSLVNDLFCMISDVVNSVGGSCKKQDMLREAQAKRIIDDLANEEIVSGQGLNQERVVGRPGDTVIDMQLQELNARFNESGMELLRCLACLDPHDSFSSFDIGKLTQFVEYYPNDFTDFERLYLSTQLENFIMDMRSNVDLTNIKGISDVTMMMVESRRDVVFPLVYKLLTLALILPVATATVERAFSGMKIVKTRLRNRMNDDWLSNSLVVYIEKEISSSLSNDVIMSRFQKLGERRGRL